MILKPNFIALIISSFVLASSCGIKKPSLNNPQSTSTKYNKLSESLIKKLEAGENVKSILDVLASADAKELETALKTDDQKKAFWLNIYNGYIIAALKKDKDQFKDRGAFFTKKQNKIAGYTLSFDDIENGIIRKSQLKFGLGYVAKPFPGKFERQFRVKERDYRIHFALNCGAKSCPPVRVYTAEQVDEQLENASKTYLTQQTKFDEKANTVTTSTLMSWFRGDFGGKSGAKKILKGFKLIPEDSNPELKFGNYDWTVDINNFTLN